MLLTCSLRTEDEDTGDDIAGRRPLLSSFLSPAFFCSQDALPLSVSICFRCFFFSLFFSGPSSLCICFSVCLFVGFPFFFVLLLSVFAPCPPMLFLVLSLPCVFFCSPAWPFSGAFIKPGKVFCSCRSTFVSV